MPSISRAARLATLSLGTPLGTTSFVNNPSKFAFPCNYLTNMTSLRRSQRQAHPIVHFDEREAYLPAPRLKKVSEKAPEPLETRPAIRPAPQCLQQLLDNPRPKFSSSIRVQLRPFKILWEERKSMSLFLKFIDYSSILAIMAAINIYAQSFMGPAQEHARDWHNLSLEEFLLFIGLLLYMGLYIEPSKRAYWNVSTHNLGRFMNLNRWEQIHRFWTIHSDPIAPD